MKGIKVKSNVFAELRLKQGLTLKGLAKRIGVHHATLSRMENEETNVRPQTALKIANELNCDFDNIFEIIDVKKGR